jgi:hypothetical protein
MDNKRDFLKNRIVDQITLFIMSDFNLSMTDALDVVYNSDLYEALTDDETGLYLESPSYVYEFMRREYLSGKNG